MIGLVGQLAARRLQVALPGRSPMDWPSTGHSIAIEVKVKVKAKVGVEAWFRILILRISSLVHSAQFKCDVGMPNELRTIGTLNTHLKLPTSMSTVFLGRET